MKKPAIMALALAMGGFVDGGKVVKREKIGIDSPNYNDSTKSKKIKQKPTRAQKRKRKQSAKQKRGKKR